MVRSSKLIREANSMVEARKAAAAFALIIDPVRWERALAGTITSKIHKDMLTAMQDLAQQAQTNRILAE